MKCCQAQKSISAMLDRELDERHTRAVQSHLDGCLRCQRFAALLPGWTQALDLLTVPGPRPGFTDRLLARIGETRTRRIRSVVWFEVLRPTRVAAAVLALSCGAVLALSINGERNAPGSRREEPAEALYTECFDAAPPDSAGARYLALLQEAEK
jgi:anti-sigma factor RsiW